MVSNASISIRKATADDLPFLWDMLYESAFISHAVRSAWRESPQPPAELVKYLRDWGREGDAGLIAHSVQGTPLGAVWYRLYPDSDRGLGVLAEPGVPEIAIAIVSANRGKGIGRALLATLIAQARAERFPALLLSVDPENIAAIALYEKSGFLHEDSTDPARGTSLIMRRTL